MMSIFNFIGCLLGKLILTVALAVFAYYIIWHGWFIIFYKVKDKVNEKRKVNQ